MQNCKQKINKSTLEPLYIETILDISYIVTVQTHVSTESQLL